MSLKPVSLLAAAAGLAATAYAGYALWLRPAPFPEGLIQVNGRIEGDHVTVASKYPGRVVELAVREGDTVRPGLGVVEPDQELARARLAQAEHEVAALEARIRSWPSSIGPGRSRPSSPPPSASAPSGPRWPAR